MAEILGTDTLRQQWTHELGTMRARLRQIRADFSKAISEASGQDYAHVLRQKGMFCLIKLQPDMVRELRETRHIFVSVSGRLNLAGMKTAEVEFVANAIGTVLKAGAA